MATQLDAESGSGKTSTTGVTRVTAVVSLGCSGLLIALLVVFLVRYGIFVMVGLGGAALGVVGGWSVVTGLAWRRMMGWVELAVGATLIIVAVLGVGGESWESVIRLALALMLFSAAVVLARASLTASLRASRRQTIQKVSAPLL